MMNIHLENWRIFHCMIPNNVTPKQMVSELVYLLSFHNFCRWVQKRKITWLLIFSLMVLHWRVITIHNWGIHCITVDSITYAWKWLPFWWSKQMWSKVAITFSSKWIATLGVNDSFSNGEATALTNSSEKWLDITVLFN